MLVTLASGLSRLGCRSIVGVFHDSRRTHTEVADRARAEGLEVDAILCRGRCDWKAVGQIRRLLDHHGVDVLHTHGYKADIYGYAASSPRRTAKVSTCHNWPDRRPIMRAYAVLDRIVLKKFDQVVAVSDSVAGLLKRSGVSNATVVPNGVDLARFRDATPTLRDEILSGRDHTVGFVGRLVPEKGGADLILAARKVLAVRPRTLFVFVGEGPARLEWQSLAERLGVSASVRFVGARADMPSVYASLDLVVLPSLAEAMPMCLLEALAARRPVIATNVGSVPRVVIPGLTGLLLGPGDCDGLADAILRLLADIHHARTMAERGWEHVALHYSVESMAAAYFGLYKQTMFPDRRSRGIGIEKASGEQLG